MAPEGSGKARQGESKPETSAQTDAAASRVEQVKGHLSREHDEDTSPKRRRRKARSDDELPADYSDLLGQMKTMRNMANTPDLSKTGYVRQKEAGKLWVRERVNLLLDKGSFREVGSVAGHVKWKQLGDSSTREEPVEYVVHPRKACMC